MNKYFTLLFLFSFNSLSSFSQKIINEIIIKENRLSDKLLKENNSNKIVISKEEIQKLSVKNVADILHYAIGVQVNSRGNNNAQTDIKINGGTFEQTLILINGHPILDPQTGHHFMNLPITQNDIEQIEIITGPQAYSYGINGIAGAINIITKSGNENAVSINVTAGSNFEKDTSNNKRFNTTNLHVGWSNSTKHAKQYLSASTDIGNGYMYNTATQNYKLLYTNNLNILNGNKISILASYINNQFGANGFYAPPYDLNSIEYVNTFFGAIKHEKKLSKHWITKTNISYRNNYDRYVFKKQDPSYYENIHRTESIFANTNLNYLYKNGEIAIGVFANEQKINSTNLDTFTRNNIGFFIENRFQWTKKLSTSIGLFANYNQQFSRNILPGAEVGYQVNSMWKIYGSIGTANRIPTYTDLYYKSATNIGNSQLIPEKSVGYDIGSKFYSNQFSLNINLFNRQVAQLIDWTKPDTASIWRPSNFGLQHVNGMNLLMAYNFKNQKRFSFQTISLSYQYLNLSIENNSSEAISKYSLDYFKHQLIAYTTFYFSKHLYTTLSARYQNRFNFKSYAIVDARLAYEAKSFRIFTDVNNMTNEKYLEANVMPMPTRWLSFGINLKFNY